MQSNIISSKDVYNIIRKTLEIMDDKIMRHGEITGYILYKMLQTEGTYSAQELVDYTMIGMIHDIGMIKTGYKGGVVEGETTNIWAHSIYGYLFLKYLSPIGERAEIVLYHHLPYNKHNLIQSKYLKIVEYLTLADKMDVYMRMQGHGMEKDYFGKYSNVEFSARALELFNRAMTTHKFMDRLKTGEYKMELDELLSHSHFSEIFKKGFLEMMVYIIDFRSKQTVLHTLATTTIAVEIGRIMRLPVMDLQVLYYGALLHDIGKIAIPLEILEAPRRLDDSEMRIMRAHVVITERILKGIIDDVVLEAAIRHHEKLDGTGYPKSIKGEELTNLQRIIALADILSALYEKRSYKDSFEAEKIKSILLTEAANDKICPAITRVVMNNYNTIIKNYEIRRKNTMGIYMTILEQYEKIYEKFKIYDH